MMDEKQYLQIFQNRKQKEAKIIFYPFSSTDFIDKEFKFSGKILDFGSSIESPNYKKTLRDNGKYFGYDIDDKTIEWLKEKNAFIDFWKTKERFDIIIGSQVYEHLEKEQREQLIKKSFDCLNNNGVLILEYPYVQNIGGMNFWKDRTHKTPPAVEDEAILMEMFGFEAQAYLAGISYWPLKNFLRLVLNILVGYHPQHNVVIIGKKA
jgi:hypothetical protein